MRISDKFKKVTVEICRIFLGLVFVFSGFVKAVDPLGVTYKNLDYLSAFGLNFFDFTAIPLAFIQSAIEFAMGICLLLGIYRRFHAFLFLAFMCVMTPLTLYLAIANPVTDCGCFGDALIITNWQTFSKNILLLAASIIIFLWYKSMTPLYAKKSKLLAIIYVYLFIFGVSFYCYAYLPILDFRPYKIGANIPELMEIPENAPTAEYETGLIYSQNGIERKFTMKDYPKEDTTWTYINTKMKLLKKGYEPPIHDFIIFDKEEDDITDEILTSDSYTFLLISHKLEKATLTNDDKINEIYDYCRDNNYNFYCLTASLPVDINEWIECSGAEYPFCTMDDIALKTIIRSNPGLLLLKEGTIINKWPNRCIPGENALTQPLEDSEWGQIPPNHSLRNISLLSLILIFPLVVLFIYDYLRNKRTKKSE